MTVATKSKQKRSKKPISFRFKDERTPKLLGMFCLFFALYLSIAFTSYLFTWQTDQDNVLKFSWSLLFQSDIDAANWLGRLGAIISNMFFYWGFGLPSYIFIFLIGLFGLSLVKRKPWQDNMGFFRYSILSLLFLSVFLAFIFRNSDFSWGGAFGQTLSMWLTSFVGTVGMLFLFLFIIIVMVVWVFNPDFNNMTFRSAITEIKDYIFNINKPQKKASPPSPLKPKEKKPLVKKEETKKETLSPIKDGQLSFEMRRKEAKKVQPLKAGEAELEIATPSTSITPELPELNTPPPQPTLSIESENKEHSEPYDPTLELSSYSPPVLPLLYDYDDQKIEVDRAELEANKDQIIDTLLHYKIEIVKIKATIGPTVTLYEIIPAPGVRISKIKNLEDDIALSLAALGIRIIAPIPGRGTIGIEVPNKKKQIVALKEVLRSDKFQNAKMDLPIGLGKTISNEVFVADLAKMPHLLISGATGQGKSVGINTVLMSILYKKHPSQVKLVLVDPKKVELFPYSKLENHFLAYLPNMDEPIITETNKVVHTLNSLCIEMDQRYDLLKKAHTRNLKEYNEKFIGRRLNPEKGHRFMPFIILIIDEFADLIMTAGKEVELPIGRLAQLARAVGIHLIIATQRPSVNIITGVIKANFPARLAFKVTSKIDSRTILDGSGAEQLIGRGDMLLSIGGDMIRLQCAFVDTPEVENVIEHIAQQQGYPVPFFLPEFHGDDDEIGSTSFKMSDLDEMFDDAARMVVQNQQGSTSMIQRRMKLGYNRAGRIMDQMEALGIVGPNEGSKAREVLIYDEAELERYLNDIKTRK